MRRLNKKRSSVNDRMDQQGSIEFLKNEKNQEGRKSRRNIKTNSQKQKGRKRRKNTDAITPDESLHNSLVRAPSKDDYGDIMFNSPKTLRN